jgi:hypothetical protein
LLFKGDRLWQEADFTAEDSIPADITAVSVVEVFMAAVSMEVVSTAAITAVITEAATDRMRIIPTVLLPALL